MRHFLFTLVASTIAQVLLYRYLSRAFSSWKGRPLLKWCVGLAVVPPILRVVSAVLPFDPFAGILRTGTFFVSVLVLGGLFALLFSGLVALVSSATRARRDSRAPAHLGEAKENITPSLTALVAEDGSASQTHEAPSTSVSRREMLERTSGALAYVSVAGLFGWGMVRGRHDFQVDECIVRVPGMSPKLDGYTIAQISDIHMGLFTGERELREGLEHVVLCKPDLLVVTGDLVDTDASHAPMLARFLSNLKFRDGVYAILGNHDHFAGGARVVSAMRAGGIRVLLNESETIRKSEGGIHIIGVDDIAGPKFGGIGPRFADAVRSLDNERPRILLAHQPNFVRWNPNQVLLQLSGHTHGGQINPGFRPIDHVFQYSQGRYEVGKTTLYVNRGFGVVGPPARIGAPPEITKFVLVSA